MLDDLTIETMKQRFISLLKTTNRNGIDNVINFLEQSDFFYAPASSLFHGNYKGGLLEHSLNVLDVSLKLYEDFKELTPEKMQNTTKESVIIAALLHDICKTYFYVPKLKSRKNENDEWEQYIGYDINDQLPLWNLTSVCAEAWIRMPVLSPESRLQRQEAVHPGIVHQK